MSGERGALWAFDVHKPGTTNPDGMTLVLSGVQNLKAHALGELSRPKMGKASKANLQEVDRALSTTTKTDPVPVPLLSGSVIISIGACLFLFWLIYGFGGGSEFDASFLAPVNAGLNSLSALCLVLGYRAVRRQKLSQHKALMLGAFLFSTLFLLSYIVYHYFHGDTPFTGTGLIRPFYFTILISHIVLSILALPMILVTFGLALTERFQIHRRWARWTLPIWLYVSVTGVAVFFLLKLFG